MPSSCTVVMTQCQWRDFPDTSCLFQVGVLPSMSHAIFNLEEILDHVLSMARESSDPDRPTLYAAARVNTQWSAIALNYLWSDMTLQHLLYFLGYHNRKYVSLLVHWHVISGVLTHALPMLCCSHDAATAANRSFGSGLHERSVLTSFMLTGSATCFSDSSTQICSVSTSLPPYPPSLFSTCPNFAHSN